MPSIRAESGRGGTDVAVSVSEPRRPTLWRTMTNEHRFGIFFLGSGLSNIGTWCQNLAGLLLVYRLTDSTLAVGLVTVCQFAWPILLVLWAGAIADRFDRRIVLAISQTGGAAISAVLAGMTLSGNATVLTTLLCISGLGVLQAVQSPAQLAMVPSLVSTNDLEYGLSLSSTQFNIARAIGPMLAAGLITFAGLGAAFLFNAVSYFAYVIALLFIRPRSQNRTGPTGSSRALFAAVSASKMMPLFIVMFVVSGSTEAVQTLGPATSVKLSGGDGLTGWFVTAFGVGAVLGALVLVPILGRFDRRLPWSVSAALAGSVVFVVAPWTWLAMVGAVLFGVGFVPSSNRLLSILQRSVGPELLGRVTALWLMAFLGGRTVYALVGGVLADAIGVVPVGLIFSTTLAIVFVATCVGRGPAMKI